MVLVDLKGRGRSADRRDKAKYISTGNVSYELRNFVLNGPDLAATLIVRCGGLPTFFRHLDTFYAVSPIPAARAGPPAIPKRDPR